MVSEKLQTVAQLEARIAPLLKGHSPDVQGAVLVVLLATWVLGHQNKEDHPALLQLHLKYVRQLIDGDDAS